jgi:hypothetical protein
MCTRCSSLSEVRMSCSSNSVGNGLSGDRRQTLKTGFDRMWPPSLPFPPSMPWLAASVSRGEAWAWVVGIASVDGSVTLASSYEALSFVGKALHDGGAHAAERKKRKKKGNVPPSACPFSEWVWNEACQVLQLATQNCDGTLTFSPPCENDNTGNLPPRDTSSSIEDR